MQREQRQLSTGGNRLQQELDIVPVDDRRVFNLEFGQDHLLDLIEVHLSR